MCVRVCACMSDPVCLHPLRAKRAAKEAKDAQSLPAPVSMLWNYSQTNLQTHSHSQEKPRVDVKKFVKIGRPGYKGMMFKKHLQ